MAMFEYFPGNYIWNLSVDIAIESGAQIGEIEEICRPIKEAAAKGADAGTAQFFDAWYAMAEKLVMLADEDESKGRTFSAATKLHRAALYYQTAERMQARTYAPRWEAFRKGIATFQKAMALSKEPYERIEIDYLGGKIPGFLTLAESVDGKVPPVMVFCNGLDSSKEMLYWTRMSRELRRRGVSVFHIDQPGTGESLRTHNLPAVYNTEAWASLIVDRLEQHPGIDPKKIGMMGISLGGYYAPRAVAMEPRFALGAVWGANHDWAEVQRRRLNREGENPVPHYWEHVRWVWGAKDQEEFMEMSGKATLDGVLEKVKVPFLVTHGEKDRQIPLEYAHKSYAALVNSPKRELKIFTDREQGVEHTSVDNLANARDYIADWIAETFGTVTG